MADKEQTLGELITKNLHEEVTLLTWIAGLSDRDLGRHYRRVRREYDDRCADYEANGEYITPAPPRSLGMLIEAMLQRLEG